MPTYKQNKNAINKWRDNHRAEWNEYMSKMNIERYYTHRDEINERRNELYRLRKDPYFKETEIFRKILL
jgi:hypothetical protein